MIIKPWIRFKFWLLYQLLLLLKLSLRSCKVGVPFISIFLKFKVTWDCSISWLAWWPLRYLKIYFLKYVWYGQRALYRDTEGQGSEHLKNSCCWRRSSQPTSVTEGRKAREPVLPRLLKGSDRSHRRPCSNTLFPTFSYNSSTVRWTFLGWK